MSKKQKLINKLTTSQTPSPKGVKILSNTQTASRLNQWRVYMMYPVKHKGYYGVVEYCNVDDLFFAVVVGIGNSSISCHGNSLDDVITEFKNCIDDYLDVCENEGWNPNTTDPEVAIEMEAHLVAKSIGNIQNAASSKDLAVAV